MGRSLAAARRQLEPASSHYLPGFPKGRETRPEAAGGFTIGPALYGRKSKATHQCGCAGLWPRQSSDSQGAAARPARAPAPTPNRWIRKAASGGLHSIKCLAYVLRKLLCSFHSTMERDNPMAPVTWLWRGKMV
jgi:hypothetical protein